MKSKSKRRRTSTVPSRVTNHEVKVSLKLGDKELHLSTPVPRTLVAVLLGAVGALVLFFAGVVFASHHLLGR